MDNDDFGNRRVFMRVPAAMVAELLGLSVEEVTPAVAVDPPPAAPEATVDDDQLDEAYESDFDEEVPADLSLEKGVDLDESLENSFDA